MICGVDMDDKFIAHTINQQYKGKNFLGNPWVNFFPDFFPFFFIYYRGNAGHFQLDWRKYKTVEIKLVKEKLKVGTNFKWYRMLLL